MVDVAIKSTDGHPLAFLPEHDGYADDVLRRILGQARTIGMVGASAEWRRPSFYAMKYLTKKGYRVIPINPARAGQTIMGETVRAAIADHPGPLDMVDVFRPSEEALEVAKEAVAAKEEKNIKVLWMQLAVRNDHAARLAEEAGLEVIMNRCPKIEFARLAGELGWCGVNSRIVSAKRPRPPKA